MFYLSSVSLLKIWTILFNHRLQVYSDFNFDPKHCGLPNNVLTFLTDQSCPSLCNYCSDNRKEPLVIEIIDTSEFFYCRYNLLPQIPPGLLMVDCFKKLFLLNFFQLCFACRDFRYFCWLFQASRTHPAFRDLVPIKNSVYVFFNDIKCIIFINLTLFDFLSSNKSIFSHFRVLIFNDLDAFLQNFFNLQSILLVIMSYKIWQRFARNIIFIIVGSVLCFKL